MVFAYYVTGHEFGHATRVAEVTSHFSSSFSLLLSFMIHYLDIALHLSLNCNFNFNCMYICRWYLILAGHDVHVVIAALEFVFTFHQRSAFSLLILSQDALTVDPLATLERVKKHNSYFKLIAALTGIPASILWYEFNSGYVAHILQFLQSSGTDILNQGQDTKYVKFLILALSLVPKFYKAKERAVEYGNKVRTDVANAFFGIVDGFSLIVDGLSLCEKSVTVLFQIIHHATKTNLYCCLFRILLYNIRRVEQF
ncbi:hypothetical protein AHAS_Ahas17G0165800 [Arachis hypogaea]